MNTNKLNTIKFYIWSIHIFLTGFNIHRKKNYIGDKVDIPFCYYNSHKVQHFQAQIFFNTNRLETSQFIHIVFRQSNDRHRGFGFVLSWRHPPSLNVEVLLPLIHHYREIKSPAKMLSIFLTLRWNRTIPTSCSFRVYRFQFIEELPGLLRWHPYSLAPDTSVRNKYTKCYL